MLLSRVFSRPSSRTIFARCNTANPLITSPSSQNQHYNYNHSSPFSTTAFHSRCQSSNKFATSQASTLRNATLYTSQRMEISKPTKKKSFRGTSNKQNDVVSANSHRVKPKRDAKFTYQNEDLASGKGKKESSSKFRHTIEKRRHRKRREPLKDLKCKSNIKVEGLVKLLREMEQHLKVKDKEIEGLKEEIAKLETRGSTWKRAMLATYLYVAVYCVNITFLVILIVGMLF